MQKSFKINNMNLKLTKLRWKSFLPTPFGKQNYAIRRGIKYDIFEYDLVYKNN